MYKLDNRFRDYDRGVVVVGCGGTGGFVAEGLCRLLSRDYPLILVDQDIVETRNLVRQNFLPTELGQFKAKALAERLSRQFQRSVGYCLEYASADTITHRSATLGCGLVIGCVDNAPARQAIANLIEERDHGWWVDAGNAENWGQVLIGNATKEQIGRVFAVEDETCVALPLPSIQRPELLIEPEVEEIDPDCAEAVQVGDQSPTINQTMAALVLEVVRRLLEGTCPWMSLFLDLDTGELKPTYATPEAVSRLTGIRVRDLLYRPNQRTRR